MKNSNLTTKGSFTPDALRCVMLRCRAAPPGTATFDTVLVWMAAEVASSTTVRSALRLHISGLGNLYIHTCALVTQ